MAEHSSPPRPGAPPRPSGSRSRAGSRPRPRKGGASWTPDGEDAPGPAKLEKPTVPAPAAAADPAGADRDDHLSMVPLTGDSGDGGYQTSTDNNSATQFFAIPGANRSKSIPPDEPKVAPRPPGPAANPIAGPVPVQSAIRGPQPVGGISGPVAAGPMPMAGMGGPMATGMGGSPYGTGVIEEERSVSYRVYAIVMGLVMMVCVALVATVLLVVVAVMNKTKEPELEDIPSALADPMVTPPSQDTGLELDKEPAPAVPRNRVVRAKPTPRPSPAPKPTSSGGSPRTAPASTPAPAAASGGQIVVTLPTGVFANIVEVQCAGSSFRERGYFRGSSKASVPNVPAEDCKVIIKGAGANKVFRSTGAKSFTCTGTAESLTCH